MNKSLKALLVSVLIYPGAGHLFLKKYVSGFSLIGAFTVPLLMVIIELIDKTNQIIARIESGDIPLETGAVRDAVSQLMAGEAGQSIDFKIIVMIAIWVVAAADAYRVGKREK